MLRRGGTFRDLEFKDGGEREREREREREVRDKGRDTYTHMYVEREDNVYIHSTLTNTWQ